MGTSQIPRRTKGVKDVNSLSRKEYLDWKRNALKLLVEWIPEAVNVAFDKTPMVPIWGDTLDHAKERMRLALAASLSEIVIVDDCSDRCPRLRRGPNFKGRSFKKRKSSERSKP